MNIKNITAGIIVTTSIMPLFAFATGAPVMKSSPLLDDIKASAVKNNSTTKAQPTTKTKPVKNFCTEIEKDTEIKNKKEVADTDNKTTLQVAKEKKLFGDQIARDTIRYGGQDDATIKTNEAFAKLEAKAVTPEKKAALEQYKKTLENALATRKTIITQAKTAFNGGTTAIIDNRTKELTGEKDIVTKEIAAALATAKTDCTNGTPAATVQARYLGRVKAARAELEKIRTLPKTKQIQAQKEIFIKTVKKADADFKTTRNAARATLMLTLGK